MTDGSAAGVPRQDDVPPLDPRSLRGLAHPLRVRLLGALREFGPATASALAGRLGESSGATSYHLRQLAAYGFVVDDPGRGTGRERWWRAAHRGSRVDSVTEFMRHPDPEVRGAINTLLYAQAVAHSEELGTWLGTMGEWPEQWQEAFDVSDYTLHLTPLLARELGERLHALVDSYRDRLPEAEAADAARVRVHVHAFPRHAD
ncbi:ArsR/SmtB family transcription factor [Streptomyces sp. NPDC020983]|uniref:ArsR/SmtB family transcription factor n=1 Tax=Streptomyces sp. NPDC020983 TaxID=3365106 RepID=UPI0037B7F0A9